MEESSVDVGNSARRNIILTLSIGGVLLLLAVFVSMYFSTGLVRPIMGMTNRVLAMKGEDMDFRVDDSMRTGDEIELLADAFERMSVKMKGYVGEIVQITAEKQRLDTELSVAADIQRNMLPNHFPAFPGRSEFDLYATMDPAKEVGGDFYDFFLVDEDHLAVIMADVSGKGVPAALFMVVSKTMIKNAALSGIYDGPASILSKVNDLLCEGNEDDMFVTVWLGILTISTGEMVSACAGHEYPVFYRKGKGFILEKDSHGIPMGGMTGIYYKECTWKLDPGDMLFLYTDGLPEAINSEEEQFGTDRMLEALEKGIDLSAQNGEAGYDRAGLKELLRQVRRQVDDFVGDTPQFDDMTMLCLKYR
jgi:sigma-B regulation protein RsbU (phosphoserine phosphatase)